MRVALKGAGAIRSLGLLSRRFNVTTLRTLCRSRFSETGGCIQQQAATGRGYKRGSATGDKRIANCCQHRLRAAA